MASKYIHLATDVHGHLRSLLDFSNQVTDISRRVNPTSFTFLSFDSRLVPSMHVSICILPQIFSTISSTFAIS